MLLKFFALTLVIAAHIHGVVCDDNREKAISVTKSNNRIQLEYENYGMKHFSTCRCDFYGKTSNSTEFSIKISKNDIEGERKDDKYEMTAEFDRGLCSLTIHSSTREDYGNWKCTLLDDDLNESAVVIPVQLNAYCYNKAECFMQNQTMHIKSGSHFRARSRYDHSGSEGGMCKWFIVNPNIITSYKRENYECWDDIKRAQWSHVGTWMFSSSGFGDITFTETFPIIIVPFDDFDQLAQENKNLEAIAQKELKEKMTEKLGRETVPSPTTALKTIDEVQTTLEPAPEITKEAQTTPPIISELADAPLTSITTPLPDFTEKAVTVMKSDNTFRLIYRNYDLLEFSKCQCINYGYSNDIAQVYIEKTKNVPTDGESKNERYELYTEFDGGLCVLTINSPTLRDYGRWECSIIHDDERPSTVAIPVQSNVICYNKNECFMRNQIMHIKMDARFKVQSRYNTSEYAYSSCFMKSPGGNSFTECERKDNVCYHEFHRAESSHCGEWTFQTSNLGKITFAESFFIEVIPAETFNQLTENMKLTESFDMQVVSHDQTDQLVEGNKGYEGMARNEMKDETMNEQPWKETGTDSPTTDESVKNVETVSSVFTETSVDSTNEGQASIEAQTTLAEIPASSLSAEAGTTLETKTTAPSDTTRKEISVVKLDTKFQLEYKNLDLKLFSTCKCDFYGKTNDTIQFSIQKSKTGTTGDLNNDKYEMTAEFDRGLCSLTIYSPTEEDYGNWKCAMLDDDRNESAVVIPVQLNAYCYNKAECFMQNQTMHIKSGSRFRARSRYDHSGSEDGMCKWSIVNPNTISSYKRANYECWDDIEKAQWSHVGTWMFSSSGFGDITFTETFPIIIVPFDDFDRLAQENKNLKAIAQKELKEKMTEKLGRETVPSSTTALKTIDEVQTTLEPAPEITKEAQTTPPIISELADAPLTSITTPLPEVQTTLERLISKEAPPTPPTSPKSLDDTSTTLETFTTEFFSSEPAVPETTPVVNEKPLVVLQTTTSQIPTVSTPRAIESETATDFSYYISSTSIAVVLTVALLGVSAFIFCKLYLYSKTKMDPLIGAKYSDSLGV